MVSATVFCLRLFALSILLLASPASAAPTLRWGADGEGGAPYVFADPKDPSRFIGFEVDLAAAIATHIDQPIALTQYDYKSLLSGLDRGDLDLAMNGLEITPDRKGKVLFSRPYYVYRQQLVARAGEARFSTLAECKAAGCTIGTLEETAASRLLERMGIASKLYEGQVEPYQDCAFGRTDAVLLDLPIAVYYAKDNPKLAFLNEPIEKGYYAIAFKSGQTELAARVDVAIGALVSSGELRSIYEKWGLWNEDQSALATASGEDVTAQAARQWTFWHYSPLLFESALTTIFLTLTSMALAIFLGLPIALARLYGPKPLQWLAIGYVELFRGIPVLLLIYFLYYGLPGAAEAWELSVSLKLGPMEAAILGFGLNYAAYEAEIYRAGIGAIPRGQWEAASALGMPAALTFRRVVLPQAVRVILPPMTNDLVALLKDTSVVSVIAVVELTKQYQILTKSSMKFVEIGAVTAGLYLVMSVPLGILSRRLEARWGRS